VFVPPPPPPPVYANQGGSTIKGLEATVDYRPIPDVSLFGGITLLDPSPASLPYAPEQSYVVGLNANLGAFRFSVDAEYVGSMYVLSQARASGAVNTQTVGSHFLLNGRVFYALPPQMGRNSEFFVALDNITNSDYVFRPGYPMPGFSAMAGVALRY
jgi:outer membrane receptor protein involved in Fe transport